MTKIIFKFATSIYLFPFYAWLSQNRDITLQVRLQLVGRMDGII